MKKFIVTGGLGFIGTQLIQYLKKNGYEAISFDKSHPFEWQSLDELNGSGWIKFIEKHQPDGVYHLAAATSAPESINSPKYYWENNVVGMKAMLNWKGPLVFASSAACYKPLNPYALTKLVGENMLEGRSNSVSYRFFNVFGYGANDGVVKHFIDAAMKGDDLEIHGDGNQIREFVHVKDLVKELAFNEGMPHVVKDIGGTRMTINQLASVIIDMTNSKSEVVHVDSREGDPRVSMSNRELANNKFFKGLEKTIKAYHDSNRRS